MVEPLTMYYPTRQTGYGLLVTPKCAIAMIDLNLDSQASMNTHSCTWEPRLSHFGLAYIKFVSFRLTARPCGRI